MIDGKPFTDVLGELEGGHFHSELTRILYQITRAVRETRKAGKIKIVLDLKPTGKGSVEIAATYDETIPEHDRPNTTFFLTDDGTLMRNDPAQPPLPLREVADTRRDPIRHVE